MNEPVITVSSPCECPFNSSLSDDTPEYNFCAILPIPGNGCPTKVTDTGFPEQCPLNNGAMLVKKKKEEKI